MEGDAVAGAEDDVGAAGDSVLRPAAARCRGRRRRRAGCRRSLSTARCREPGGSRRRGSRRGRRGRRAPGCAARGRRRRGGAGASRRRGECSRSAPKRSPSRGRGGAGGDHVADAVTVEIAHRHRGVGRADGALQPEVAAAQDGGVVGRVAVVCHQATRSGREAVREGWTLLTSVVMHGRLQVCVERS